MKYIVDMKGNIVGKYEEGPQGDLISREALKKAVDDYAENRQDTLLWQADIEELIDNAPIVSIDWGSDDGERTVYTRPQGECKGCEYLKDCETCEDKAKQYSLGFQDGYLLGGFQLTELRRWLIAQGYSEGTVDDKIEGFGKFVKRIREDEG